MSDVLLRLTDFDGYEVRVLRSRINAIERYSSWVDATEFVGSKIYLQGSDAVYVRHSVSELVDLCGWGE